MRPLLLVAAVVASAYVVMLGVAWLGRRTPRRQVWFALLAVLSYAAVLWGRPDSLLVSDTTVIIFAMGLAPILARSLGTVGALAAFAITASLVDLLSFGGGLTRRIIQDFNSGSSDLLQFLAFTVSIDGRPRPLVGVVDLLIAGALFLALTRLHDDRRRATVTVLGALAAAVVVGLTVGGVAAVPFLGFAAVVDGWLATRGDGPRARRTRAEPGDQHGVD